MLEQSLPIQRPAIRTSRLSSTLTPSHLTKLSPFKTWLVHLRQVDNQIHASPETSPNCSTLWQYPAPQGISTCSSNRACSPHASPTIFQVSKAQFWRLPNDPYS